eukprot:3390575-Rhodomonas_salina.1
MEIHAAGGAPFALDERRRAEREAFAHGRDGHVCRDAPVESVFDDRRDHALELQRLRLSQKDGAFLRLFVVCAGDGVVHGKYFLQDAVQGSGVVAVGRKQEVVGGCEQALLCLLDGNPLHRVFAEKRSGLAV